MKRPSFFSPTKLAIARTAIAIIILRGAQVGFGQGTIQPLLITFDGSPTQLPGTAVLVAQYTEGGVTFTQLRQVGANIFPNSFARVGSGSLNRPNNGTAYLQAGSTTDTFICQFADGRLFDFLSVHLGEYSTVVPNAVTTQITGYRPNGSSVSMSVTTDGIIDGAGGLEDFQLFRFQGYEGINRLEFTTTLSSFSMDNLELGVPEPGSGDLLALGGLIFAARSRRRAAITA